MLSLSKEIASARRSESLSETNSNLVNSPLLASKVQYEPSIHFTVSTESISSGESPRLPNEDR